MKSAITATARSAISGMSFGMPTGPRYPGRQPVASMISASDAKRQPSIPGSLPILISLPM